MNQVYRKGQDFVDSIRTTVVPEDGIAIWHLGQSGAVVKTSTGGQDAPFVAVDPYLTRSIEEQSPDTEFVRAFDPPIQPEDLAGATAVLITHQHDDHMDLSTIQRLHHASPETKFVVPRPHCPMLLDVGVAQSVIVPAEAGTAIEVDGFQILPIAAAHVEYTTDDAGCHLYLGYVMTTQTGISVYHSGDTLVTEQLVETLSKTRPNVAMLPINGGDYARTKRGIVGNMSARDAVDLAAEIGVDMLIANHYDMFPNNRDNPGYFVDYLFHNYPSLPFRMLAVGERYVFLK